MTAADALDQAEESFRNFTGQASRVAGGVLQGAANTLPGVQALNGSAQLGSQLLQRANQQGFYNNPIAQHVENSSNAVMQAATTLPDFSKSLPGVSQAFSYLHSLNDQLSNQGILGKIGSMAGGLGLGVAEGAVNVPTSIIRGAAKQGEQLGNAESGNDVDYQKLFGGVGDTGMGLLNASMANSLPVIGRAVENAVPQAATALGRIGQQAIAGGKFGGEYGFLSGLKTHENAANLFSQFTQSGADAAQNAVAGLALGGGLGAVGEGVSAGINALQEAHLGSIEDAMTSAAHQMRSAAESVQTRDQGGRYGTKTPGFDQSSIMGNTLPPDTVPRFEVTPVGGRGSKILTPDQVLEIPNWKNGYQAGYIKAFNPAAEMMLRSVKQGGFINFGADMGGTQEQPTENPTTGDQFQASLGEPTSADVPPNTAGTAAPPPPIPNQSLPESSLGVATSADLPQTSPAAAHTPATAQTPQTPQSSFVIASDKSIASPSNQAVIDQAFATAKISKETPLSGTHELVKAVANIFDPVAGTVQGADITNAFQNHRAVFDLAQQQAAKTSEDLTSSWDKVSPQDHLKFIQGIESGTPIDVKGIDPGIAQQYQQRFADDYKIQQSIRPDAPYRENYFTQSGIWQDPQKASEFYNQWQKASLSGSQGFFEQRAFPTVLDGVKAGLTLKETNPETLYLNNHTQVLKAKMADDFAKEAHTKGYDPSLVQQVVDRYMDPGIAGNAIYKTARAANAALNSFQLGLSAFHFTTTTMNAFTSRVAQGIEELSQGHPVSGIGTLASTPVAPLQMLLKGNKMLSDAFTDTPQLSEDVQHVLTGGGKLGGQNDVYKVGAWEGMMKNIRQGQVIPAALKLPFGVMEKITSPLMDWYVPRMKLGAFADLASSKLQNLGENPTPETQRAALGQAWDSIDNRFGQLVQDKLLWNKTFKDVVNLSTRSLGWNLGTAREIGGGVINLKNAPGQMLSGKGIDSNTAYTLALPIMTALGASVYSYLHGTPLSSVKDFFYPQTGETKQPKPGSPDQTAYPERVSQPGYAKDVYAFSKNPVSTVLNKTSPLLSLIGKAVELGQTGGIKDYFGNQVVNPTAPPLEKAGQLAKFGASQFSPFSLSGQNQRVGQNLETKAESAFGFQPAPASITKGDNADLLNQAYTNKLTPQQAKQLFQLQQQGMDPHTYMNSILQGRTQAKQDRAAGTDLTSQKDAAVKAYIQSGDASQAQALGFTNRSMRSYVQGRMKMAADAFVAGDTKTASDMQQTYGAQIPPKVLQRAAHDRAFTLLQTYVGYQRQGQSQQAAPLIDQVQALEQQYQFQLTTQDKLKLGLGKAP